MCYMFPPRVKMIRGVLLVSFLVCGYSLPAGKDGWQLSFFDVPETIIANGYQAERHHVITPDGYILEMHRIPFGRHQTESDRRRPAAFLMHGLLSASNAYIALGPKYSIAYNLADAGFDVWMGNARGNKLSRRHVTLDPDADKSEFFNFSWEEIGMIDVAAMIDYILEFTGEEKLHYVGHSQGGTSFLVLSSMKPEYNEKFTSVNLLAGVGYMDYFPNSQLASTAMMTDVIYLAALAVGFVEVFPPDFDGTLPWDRTSATGVADRCTGNIETKYMCELIGVRHLVRDNDVSGASDILDIFGDPENVGGGALKQVAHYGQNIRDKAFRRWNYGFLGNLRVYGTTSPPPYDLGLITANVTMHYTVNDNLLDERDVLAMAADMPNTVVRRVARDTFLHEDFAAATDVKELVTDFMIASMLKVEDLELEVDNGETEIPTDNPIVEELESTNTPIENEVEVLTDNPVIEEVGSTNTPTNDDVEVTSEGPNAEYTVIEENRTDSAATAALSMMLKFLIVLSVICI